MKIIVCAHREWNIRLFREKISKFPGRFFLVSRPGELNERILKKVNPDIIFFLDWSWIVPARIIKKYKCVGFHAADLPRFRGGSPIQNQIIRGVKKTKLTAFLMNEGIDSGDILLKRKLSLEGCLKDIFKRMGELFCVMIKKMIAGKCAARKQTGKGSCFRRRKPRESRMTAKEFKKPLTFIHDFIRMLEDPYPNAYLAIGNKKIAFKEAFLSKDGKKIKATVEITK